MMPSSTHTINNTFKTVNSKNWGGYNAELDFWRCLFSILIVFSHGIFLADTESGDKLVFGRALIGVEFFFVVSGFLLAKSVRKRKGSTLAFIKHKYFNLAPYFWTSFVFCFVVWLYMYMANQPTLWQLLTKISKSIWDLLWMSGNGDAVSVSAVNATWWYLCALLFAEWFLHPILCRYERQFKQWAAPIAIFLILSYLSRSLGRLSSFFEEARFVPSFSLRALLGVCIGCEVFYACEYFQKYQFRKWISLFLVILEILCYAFVFACAHHNTPTRTPFVDYSMDFVCLLVLAIAVGITASEKSILAGRFPAKACRILGKWGTCLYLTHYSVVLLLKNYLPAGISYYKKLVILFAISSFVAALVLIIAEAGRDVFNRYKFTWKAFFVDEVVERGEK